MDLRRLAVIVWSWSLLVISLAGLPVIASVAGSGERYTWTFWGLWVASVGYALWAGRVIRRTYLPQGQRRTS